MKKLIVILLALMFVFSFAACNNDGDTEETSTASTGDTKTEATSEETEEPMEEPEEVDIYGAYDPPIEIEVVRNVQLADTDADFSQTVWVKEYERTLGIKLTYKLQAFGEQYDNKVNLLLASNDLPDMMQVNLTQLYSMIDAEQCEDLSYAWENYATDQAKEAMTSDGTQNFDMVTRDGALYAIPNVGPAIETAHHLFLREDWRKDLGLPVPETYEDFEDMLYAFTNDDPDGNGADDTFGLSLSKELWGDGHDATTFFNCFGAYPNAWVEDGNGGLIYGGVMEGMKPALEKLAQYYKDGIINQEFVVNDQAKAGELFAQETVGSFFGIQWAGFLGDAFVSLYTNTEGQAEVWGYKIPKATDDAGPIMYNTTSSFYTVTAGFEHPEALVKMTDLIIFMGRGPQNEGPWAVEEFGDWREDVEDPYEDWLAVADEQGYETVRDYDLLWDDWDSAFICPEVIHNNVQRWLWSFDAIETGDPSPMEGNFLAMGLYEGLVEWSTNGKPSNGANHRNTATGELDFANAALWFNLENCGNTFMDTLDERDAGTLKADMVGAFVSDTMLEKQATLDKLELETVTRIITGESSIDEWDNYLEQWYALGGQQITDEINAWYADMK
jgi:putative aldouronate transport system substrate-binding protein